MTKSYLGRNTSSVQVRNPMTNFCAIVLAAGEGIRMGAEHSKLLHPVLGRPMIYYPVNLCLRLGAHGVFVVAGTELEAVAVKEALAGQAVQFLEHGGPNGMVHAVLQAEAMVTDVGGTVLIFSGDTPPLREKTIRALLDTHHTVGAVATVVTAPLPEPNGRVRILRDMVGPSTCIVDEIEATPRERQITEVNTGCYCIARPLLFGALREIARSPGREEFSLRQLVEVFTKWGMPVHAVAVADPIEVMGINTPAELAQATAILRQRIHERLMSNGVTLLDPTTTYIDATVQVGPDTVIYPGVTLEGTTTIGSGCILYPHCRLRDSQLGDGVTVLDGSVILQSDVAADCVIGPYAHLRPGSRLQRKAKVGNFCEVKKAVIGEGSKVPHLSYIGDATLGAKVNIGAGTITCNFDGFAKHQTLIEDDVFVGSNTNLVAPVNVGKGAIIAAGSTITDRVPPDAVAFGRAPQVTKEGRATATRQKRQAMAPPKADED